MNAPQSLAIPAEPGTPFAGGTYAGRFFAGLAAYALFAVKLDFRDWREVLESLRASTASEKASEAPCETCNDDPQVCATVPGLRDFFAAHAMQGFLASLEYGGSAGRNPDKCAEWAYQQADAMLKARESVLARENDS